MVDVSGHPYQVDRYRQDPVGLGVGVAVVAHAIAFAAAYVAAGWELQRAGGPATDLDAGGRFAVNLIWLIAFGAAQVIVLGLCLLIGISAILLDRTRFGWGVLGGWLAGLIVVGACGVALFAAA